MDGPDAPERRLQAIPADQFVDGGDELEAEPLLGSRGETILPRAGLLIMAGVAGSTKTTLTLDAVAHMSASVPWLGLDVPRRIRFLLIENEGPRGKFRQKLAEKMAAWPGPEWEEMVRVLDEPWGRFSFADEGLRRELVDYCQAEAIDVVVADPLDSLGVIGAGTPEDTRTFVAWLRECGLFNDTAFWLLHHFSKAPHRSVVQQLSGAWGGHADTIVGVELDGTRRTKLTWAKLRWATPRDAQVLEWVLEERGFRAVDLTPAVHDDELLERIRAYLADQAEAVSTRNVQGGVRGDGKRIASLLKSHDAFANTGTEKRPKWALAATNAVPTLLDPENAVNGGTPHSHEEELAWR